MLHLLLFSVLVGAVAAESGIEAWLRYAPLPSSYQSQFTLPSSIMALDASRTSPVYTAGRELQKGLAGIFGEQIELYREKCGGLSVVVGTVGEYEKAYGNLSNVPELEKDGFWLSNVGDEVQILGQNERAALYGTFEYLSMLAQGNFSKVNYATNPSNQVRWVNQWDNMDGTIERGFGCLSIFFADNAVVDNLTRAAENARLLASIRVNAVVVNNVNANYTTLEHRNIKGLARIADVFRPYGVTLGLSLDFASPMELGDLDTYDPLDPHVISWWTNKTAEI